MVTEYSGSDFFPEGVYIQGSYFPMEKRGNYLAWEGYKELNGDGGLFSITFSAQETARYCFYYKINTDSLSIFERTEYDVQNVFQTAYSEKPIRLIGNFPFVSQKFCGS